MRRFRPSPATVIALVALFVALGGPAWAKKKLLVGSSNIKRDAVTSRHVRDGSLSQRDLRASAVRFLQRTPDRAIRGSQIATGAITGDKLAPASVGSAAVADNTLTAADIAPGSLTAAVLGADSVGFDEIADGAVGKAALRTAAVGKAELGDSAVGMEELGASIVTVNFTEIDPGECQAVDTPLTLPIGSPDLTSRFISISVPPSWPDTLTLAPRAADGQTLRLNACNPTNTAVTPTENQVVPYVALVP